MAIELSHQQVEKFTDIYRRVYGVMLTPDEAQAKADKLIQLVQFVTEDQVHTQVNRNPASER